MRIVAEEQEEKEARELLSYALDLNVDYERVLENKQTKRESFVSAFHIYNTVRLEAKMKRLLICKFRFSSTGPWYTALMDDGANVHMVDFNTVEKEKLPRIENANAVRVNGIGGGTQVFPLETVSIEFPVKDGSTYGDMLPNPLASDLRGTFDAIICKEFRARKQLNKITDFVIDCIHNTIWLDGEYEIDCNEPIRKIKQQANYLEKISKYKQFRRENPECYYTNEDSESDLDNEEEIYTTNFNSLAHRKSQGHSCKDSRKGDPGSNQGEASSDQPSSEGVDLAGFSSAETHRLGLAGSSTTVKQVGENQPLVCDLEFLPELVSESESDLDISDSDSDVSNTSSESEEVIPTMEGFRYSKLKRGFPLDTFEGLDMEENSSTENDSEESSVPNESDSEEHDAEYSYVARVFDLEKFDGENTSAGELSMFSYENKNYVCHVEKVLSSKQSYVKPETFEKNIERLFNLKELDLPKHLQNKFRKLLEKFRGMTQLPVGEEVLGPVNTKEQLELREKPGSVPVSRRAYDFGPDQMKELHIQLQFLLAHGFIRPSKSPYGAPVIFAPKKDGKWRMAIDYRELNKQTVDDNYGIPKIEGIFDQIASVPESEFTKTPGRSKFFTTIDLVWAYWQLKVAENSIEKTTLNTPSGSYDFLVCRVGLKQMPSHFQRVVESALRPLLYKICMVYLDDIIIYSATAEDHLQHIELVFEALAKANLHFKLEKCEFFCKNVHLLGWIVGRDGRKIDPRKVTAISEYKKPKTYAQLARFIGAINHLGPIIPNVATLLLPLTDSCQGKDIRKVLERNGVSEEIKWDSSMDKSFKATKEALVSAPVLKLIDPTKDFVLKCDASETTISAAHFQYFNGVLHPVAYFSRKLSAVEQRWHIIEKEAFSYVEPLRRWEKYFPNSVMVKIEGDSDPVRAITRMKNPKPKHLRWLLDIQNVNHEYNHVKGQTNVFPDAFTRQNHVNTVYLTSDNIEDEKHRFFREALTLQDYVNQAVEGSLDLQDDSFGNDDAMNDNGEKRVRPLTPVFAIQSWLKNIEQSYRKDPLAMDILNKKDTTETRQYRVLNKLIYRKPANQQLPKALYVPNDLQLRVSIIEAFHGTSFSMHFDAKRTTEKILRNFYWPSLKEDVLQHIKSCKNCLRGKYRTVSRSAISIPMDIPSGPWLMIGIDAKTGLPMTERGHDMFWMVTDYFTGMMHIIPSKKEGQTSEKLARLFLAEVFRHHGLPLKIVSDRDTLFTAGFWNNFWREVCTILNMSTARSPWTDGKSERYIRTAIELFRTFALENPRD
jgi:hypothetical protein